MSKARDLANAGTALTTVSATELGYLDGVTSNVQTQINTKDSLPSRSGQSGKYLTNDGTNASWGTVSQYALPSQTGNAGKFLTTNGTSESWGTVNQPITWTQRAPLTDINGNGVRSIAYNGSNLYVGIGNSGKLITSTDGITWTARTSGFGASSINSVSYGNNIWVIAGESGKISTSTDGITWTARTSNAGTSTLYKVRYLNSLWIAVGTEARIVTSTDAITWTARTSAENSLDCWDVAFGGGYYVIIGNPTSSPGRYAVIHSTNGTSWSTYASSINRGFSNGGVFYSNGYFYVSKGDQSYSFANPTVAWSGTSEIYFRTQFHQGANNFYTVNTPYVLNYPLANGTGTGTLNNLATGALTPLRNENSGLANDSAIYVTSTGGYIIADSAGRIFTSF